MAQGPAHSPMFRQYHALKQDHQNEILLFRMGDFYEMFYDDAKTASRLLELTLTARGKGTDNVVPMCGFPHHQLDAYTAKLVRANQSVAICEQVEDPKKVKGLVKREVVRRVTPGTLNDPDELDARDNQWIAALARVGKRWGIAMLDVSTGAFWVWETHDGGSANELAERIIEFVPREIVVPEGLEGVGPALSPLEARVPRSDADPFSFILDDARRLLLEHLNVGSLDGFGLRDATAAVAAGGGLLQYLQDTQRCGWEHIDRVRLYRPDRRVRLDPATLRNLELVRSARDGGRGGTLLEAIDRTLTAAGGRKLRRLLCEPLLDVDAIRDRLDAVEDGFKHPAQIETSRGALGGVHDIERLLSKTVSGSATPRDLLSLRHSLERLPDVLDPLAPLTAALLRATVDDLDRCDDIRERLATMLADEPSANLRDGGVLRDGASTELDTLRAAQRDGKSYIASLEAREREATGIASLKVRYNKVFGYFIEVSKANLHLVPESYQRKQTIANGERYVTPELKEHESNVLNAQERIEALELELFQALRAEVASHASRLKAIAEATALLDVLMSFSDQALRGRYVRPTVDASRTLRVVGGRHPVVERHLDAGRFVPNDTGLDGDERGLGILTGPNMGGKSTYLRQVALIALLAQTGSFVPADEATIGIVDRIFCRVGASDSLAEGQSTFMVEMTETALILNEATDRSLVILDEIGRGTATYDGLSIAWAVVEHLHARSGGAPRTLFATHYHELTELALELSSVFNLRMAVREWGDDVRFLHRVEEGAADRSYGIQVARLAGIPRGVVDRAREILLNLERDALARDGRPRRARPEPASPAQPSLAGLFEAERPQPPAEDPAAAEVLAELRALRAEEITPLDAINRVWEWSRRLRDTPSEDA